MHGFFPPSVCLQVSTRRISWACCTTSSSCSLTPSTSQVHIPPPSTHTQMFGVQEVILTVCFDKGFGLQATILLKMFHLVESGQVRVPLWDPSKVSDPSMTNQRFLREYIMNLLNGAFPHLSKYTPPPLTFLHLHTHTLYIYVSPSWLSWLISELTTHTYIHTLSLWYIDMPLCIEL